MFGANSLREQVMAGSGHLQTFKLLRFLRNRNSADGHVNYGVQMAVSLPLLIVWSHISYTNVHSFAWNFFDGIPIIGLVDKKITAPLEHVSICKSLCGQHCDISCKCLNFKLLFVGGVFWEIYTMQKDVGFIAHSASSMHSIMFTLL